MNILFIGTMSCLTKYIGKNIINHHVLWIDSSMNIKLVEKNHVQSAHYSGRQQTLHDISKRSIMERPFIYIYIYIYHLSDDTKYDSVMTKEIIKITLTQHPEIISSGELIIRSDNCSMQYKSCYVS